MPKQSLNMPARAEPVLEQACSEAAGVLHSTLVLEILHACKGNEAARMQVASSHADLYACCGRSDCP